MNWIIFGFILYLIVILIIGLITYNANKSHKDYFIGNRQLNPLLVAFSERTAGESAWLLLALPGAALSVGLVEIWTALGCILGIIAYWYLIAEDLRVKSERTDSITLPSFLSDEINDESKSIKIVATLIIIFFFTIYLAAQFVGAGITLETSFHIENKLGILIGASVIIIYTMLGGFLAVVWTDLIQGIIMIGTLIVLPIVGFIYIWHNNIEFINYAQITGTHILDLTGGKTGWASLAAIIGGLSWGFGYFGQPHLVTKFMAIKNSDQIKIGRRIAFAWAIPAFIGAFLIGFLGLSIFGAEFFRNTNVEKVMPLLAIKLIPDWLAGILISGAIAAMMSTADSLLLVLVSAVIEDIYHKTLQKNISEKKLLIFSRIITLVIGIIAILIAFTSKELIFQLVSYAWSGLGASFGPALILILKWKKITKNGILAGMIIGAISTIIWQSIPELNNAISVRFVSFFLAFLAIIIVSQLKGKEVEQT